MWQSKFRLFVLRIKSRGLQASLKTKAFHIRAWIKVTTSKKLFNLLAIKIQKWLRSPYVWGMPYRYVIDPVNYCVLNCPLCPTGRKRLGRIAGRISLDKFKTIIDRIYPYTYYIDLFNWGEPFLHPQIMEMIEYASSKKIIVRISSNLNAFRPNDAEKLVRSGLTDLIVSIDGADQETYSSYRKGGNLSYVIESVRAIVKAKETLSSNKPFINIRMLISRKNEHVIDQVRKLAESLHADTFSFSPIFINPNDQSAIVEWLPQNPNFSCYQSKQGKYQVENVWNCADLWEQMAINWDGSVLPCCWLHEKEFDFGNIFITPIEAVWNNEYYMNSRRVFSNSGPREKPHTVCVDCKGRPEFHY